MIVRALPAALLCLLPLACGCALSAPPAETVLHGGEAADASADGAVPLGERARRWQQELDRRAADALAQSKAAPGDADAALRATALLFAAADLRLQRGSLEALDALPEADLDGVLGADDRVADGLRTEILSLCTAGLEAAERAAAARPQDVAARLHVGLHLSLIAWANGPARSLFAGYGSRLVAAIAAAVAADPAFDHGAPLRLQGRFRGKAPWPYDDLEQAQSSLERAVALAPIAINELFLGDVLFAAGERDAARAAWQAATTAGGDESTQWSTPLLRELARRRLQALARLR